MASEGRWSRQVAARIKRAIHDSGWSDSHVSEQSGIALSTLRRRVAGHDTWRLAEIEAIARTLRIDPDALVTNSVDRADAEKTS